MFVVQALLHHCWTQRIQKCQLRSPNVLFVLLAQAVEHCLIVQILKDESGIVPSQIQGIVRRQFQLRWIDLGESRDDDAEENLENKRVWNLAVKR